MKPFGLCKIGMRLHPAVTTNGSVATEVDDIRRAPGSTLAAFDSVMEAVRLLSAAFAQAL